MGFFDRRRDSIDDEIEIEDDDALESPAIHLGGVVPIEALLARSETAAAAIRGMVGYPDGFAFTLAVWVRTPVVRRRRRLLSPIMLDPLEIEPGEEPPPEFFRLGIEFPDGSSVTNLDRPPWELSPDATDPHHGMESSSGGGSDTFYEQNWWAWPVPGPGVLAFVCEWPAYSISETRYELDASLVRAASERAEPVWPDLVGPLHLTRTALVRRAGGLTVPDPND